MSGVLDYLSKNDEVLELDLLVAYGHERMDTTLRDRKGYERLWLMETLPWKRW
jgi:hypothetical protein